MLMGEKEVLRGWGGERSQGSRCFPLRGWGGERSQGSRCFPLRGFGTALRARMRGVCVLPCMRGVCVLPCVLVCVACVFEIALRDACVSVCVCVLHCKC